MILSSLVAADLLGSMPDRDDGVVMDY